MSVEINGTIYAGEKGLLLGGGGQPGWECPVGCGEGGTLPGLPIFQSSARRSSSLEITARDEFSFFLVPGRQHECHFHSVMGLLHSEILSSVVFW